MILDRNKYYTKSDFKIDCDNHKKNQIVDSGGNIHTLTQGPRNGFWLGEANS